MIESALWVPYEPHLISSYVGLTNMVLNSNWLKYNYVWFDQVQIDYPALRCKD